jgi:lambda repressor-like predicted transcriptional regulator
MGNTNSDWQCVASRLVKAELEKRGLTYRKLSEQLAMLNVTQSEATLRSKISKGNFGAALLLQILHVLKADINPLELGVILEGCEQNKK